MAKRLHSCFGFRKGLLSFYSRYYPTAAFHSSKTVNWIPSPSERPNQSNAACGDIEYMHLEDVENIERYRPGEYHPIAIGDYLHDRYETVQKLGFGSYSTTWLARDHETAKCVAVKITVAAENLKEGKILRLLGFADTKDEGHVGKASIPPVLDDFFIHGPNGKHQCIVTAPAMMDPAEAKDASYSRLFQLPVAKAIIAQIIQAVAFLHDRGIVHAGKYLCLAPFPEESQRFLD